MDGTQTYCGDHFVICTYQIIMYTLNLYNVISQLYFNKAGGKNKNQPCRQLDLGE